MSLEGKYSYISHHTRPKSTGLLAARPYGAFLVLGAGTLSKADENVNQSIQRFHVLLLQETAPVPQEKSSFSPESATSTNLWMEAT